MADISTPVLLLLLITAAAVGIIIGKFWMAWRAKSYIKQWKAEVEKDIRSDAINRSRVTLGGKMAEQLAPYFPDFPYDPTEARFIGSPVDFIVFSGTANGEPNEVVFVEVKTGDSTLSAKQKKLKQVIQDRKVRWEQISLKGS